MMRPVTKNARGRLLLFNIKTVTSSSIMVVNNLECCHMSGLGNFQTGSTFRIVLCETVPISLNAGRQFLLDHTKAHFPDYIPCLLIDKCHISRRGLEPEVCRHGRKTTPLKESIILRILVLVTSMISLSCPTRPQSYGTTKRTRIYPTITRFIRGRLITFCGSPATLAAYWTWMTQLI